MRFGGRQCVSRLSGNAKIRSSYREHLAIAGFHQRVALKYTSPSMSYAGNSCTSNVSAIWDVTWSAAIILTTRYIRCHQQALLYARHWRRHSSVRPWKAKVCCLFVPVAFLMQHVQENLLLCVELPELQQNSSPHEPLDYTTQATVVNR